MKRIWLTAPLAASLLVASPAVQEKGGVDLTGPYDVVANWMKPVEEGVTTYVIGVFAETPDRVLVTATGATPGKQVGVINLKAPGAKLDHLMMVMNRDGRVVEEWRQWYPQWGNPHVARINPYDPAKHIWFIDRESHQLYELTHDGKTLVKTLGEHGVTAVDDKHFGRPAEIAWLPDGTMFVADGYQNRRVVKLDKDGKFIASWGSEGKAPGQFGGVVHCVAVDPRRHRVYVADAGNHRVQIFDEGGKYLEEWPLPGPTHLMVMDDGSVWILDITALRMLKYSPEGKLLTYWGTAGDFPGGFDGAHDFSVDPEGNLYIDMGFGHRIEKFVARPGADRSRLVGQPIK
jgi:DNA-binding beta-propeller fold protein YncE